MRTAVVGHVEWVEFVRVDRVPGPGEIIQARETWAEAVFSGNRIYVKDLNHLTLWTLS